MNDRPKRSRRTSQSSNSSQPISPEDSDKEMVNGERISYLEGAYNALATREDIREAELRLHRWVIAGVASVLTIAVSSVSVAVFVALRFVIPSGNP